MNETERRDETGIVALRTALQDEVPLPSGMRRRMEAGVAAQMRRDEWPSTGFLGVAAVCAFVGGSSAVGLGAAAAPVVVTGTLASAAYALWLRNVLSPEGDRR
ncbi:MAG: hypothetical protein ACYC6F_17580 [Longimicrobiales bacterium]